MAASGSTGSAAAPQWIEGRIPVSGANGSLSMGAIPDGICI